MGCYGVFSKFSRRGKFFALLIFSLMVVAWIATYSGDTVKRTAALPTLTQNALTKYKLKVNFEALTSSPSDLNAAQKHPCPDTSPLLKGSVNLTFPALKLKDVEMENPDVSRGEFQPPNCTARQSVAILIPHRNREKHLLYLLHHLHPFLQRQQLHYAIYIIQQTSDATFNRAKLLNIGYLEALKDFNWDCFVFHDVDLVPENDHNLYICDKHPKHLVVGRNVTGYKLRYKGYFGGVTALSREQFLKVNGFSNTYWGWGGEDDDLRIRVQLQKMEILRPPADVARYTMVFHKRDSGNQINKDRMKLLAQTPKVWRTDGLNSCSYKTVSLERLPLYVNVTVDVGKPER
ncbi:beta-1,4-galactosyltransferase 4 [Oryzias melastigma]|uniref:Beta-1,4-galactosyltransferase n=1 Tax=Oryzias melastigma TaxID=30732 RepID=A0A3B3CS24_ORYME|nr:beta-1,4-galactosyltransferase 4 [Oryzias melastigma]XP_024121539.1 beta-1,4-galactosyltransferase 4 [Oryzias melastigma]